MPAGRWVRPSPGLVTVLLAPVVLLLALVGYLRGSAELPVLEMTLPVAFGCVLTAPLALTGAPGHPVGRLLAGAAVLAGAGTLAACWSRFGVPAWFGQWLWLPPLPLIFLALLFFPDGLLPSRRWRPVAAGIVVAAAVSSGALAVAAVRYPHSLLTSVDDVVDARTRSLLAVGAVAAGLLAVGFLAVVASLGVRWRRSGGDARHQAALLLPAGLLLVAALVAVAWNVPYSWTVGAAAVPVAITLAILRYRLYDLDRVINRGAVWYALTALVVAVFLASAALLGRAVPGNAALVTIVLVSAVLAPLCQWAARAVDRLVYGDRDDPYRVLARVGDLVGATADPGALLPSVVRTIAASLRVPYVAMEVRVRQRSVVIAEFGRGGDAPAQFPMLARGEPIGRLLVAPRTTGGRFTARECRLLAQVAVQAAAAADAVRLVEELRDSRERLVTAREEERRRLRRDLHDGIGPTLAGMSMQLLAAYRLVEPQSRAGQVLATLKGDLQVCRAETRQLVDQLRPAVLDRGLREGLAAECRRFDSQRLRVSLSAEDRLDGLPAAVEVAAYRIVAEALTNVARHAGARSCGVEVRRGTQLEVQVVDDGVGLAVPGRRGVGLESMRERAEELGGDCVISATVPHGTTVRVRLPLPVEGVRRAGERVV